MIKQKLVDQVRHVIRVKHLSYRTRDWPTGVGQAILLIFNGYRSKNSKYSVIP